MKKIIIIDQEVWTRDELTSSLETHGYEVVMYPVPATAIARCKVEMPALIICDYEFPIKNGLEAIRDIRAISATVPIIFISESNPDILTAGKEAGASVALPKLCGLAQLLTQVQKLLPNEPEPQQ